MSFRPKPCKKCGSPNHTAMTCSLTPRKPLQNKKRLKKAGKIGSALIKQRKEFLKDYEPPYLCVYCLVIGYENFLLPEWLNVEHGESKTRHPDKRFAKANLYISCRYHNKEKGSMDIDEYITKLKEQYNAADRNTDEP